MALDTVIALHIPRHSATFCLSGLFQVVVLLAVAFGVALVVGEVRCIHVVIPVKINTWIKQTDPSHMEKFYCLQ